MKIKTALLSVSEKSNIIELARALHKSGVHIISSAGTYKHLREAKIPAEEISAMTGFPEILDGRVKTLHPKVYGGILAKKDKSAHLKELKEADIPSIDLVVVNLYPFEKIIGKKDTDLDKAVENIDIGGVALLRAAAKNFKYVTVLTDPDDYEDFILAMKKNGGSIPDDMRRAFAVKVFQYTSSYDSLIGNYLAHPAAKTDGDLPQYVKFNLNRVHKLRYGENPHQRAAFYSHENAANKGLAGLKKLHGKELSFNNILDLSSTGGLLSDFDEPCACIVKHTNPCGIAAADNIVDAFKKAHASDPLSAFGGIVGLNRPCDGALARAISEAGFLECILAPSFDKEALEILTAKKNLRLVAVKNIKEAFSVSNEYISKEVAGGILIQEADHKRISKKDFDVVTKKVIDDRLIEDLLFAWKVVKHVKSNAIVIAKGKQLLGLGSGVTSRVDAVIMACRKAGERAAGAVLASDAFFPKPDNITVAAGAGITAIIQPGGSIGDSDVIGEADHAGIAMVFTGTRHFKH